MNDADRTDPRSAKRALESAGGTVIRATRKGALVLETENARRMMRRFRARGSDADTDPVRRSGTAAARP